MKAGNTISVRLQEGCRRCLPVVGTLLCLWLSSCGYSQAEYRWDTRFIEVERAFDHNRLTLARDGYKGLLSEAERASDRRFIKYRLAMILEREGEHQQAVAGYERLWSGGELDETSGYALYRAGRVMYDHLDQQEQALQLWEGLMTSRPEAVAADRALIAVLNHHEGSASLLVSIDRLYRQLRDTKLGDNLLYRRAMVSRGEGDDEATIVALQRLLERHPLSGLTDDARWILAELFRARGEYTVALEYLKRLSEDRESSWLVGTYDSEFADDARFRRGIIYLVDLESPGSAEREFRRFLRDFSQSILRDDARWNIVESRLARGDGGGATEACEGLMKSEPESRWVDDCQRTIAALEAGVAATSLAGRPVLE